MADLDVLVNLGIEDGWLGGVVKVAFSQSVSLGERDTSAGGGRGYFTFFSSRWHKLGEFGGVLMAGWVRIAVGGHA